MHRNESEDERFWRRVDKSSENGCWNWIGSVTEKRKQGIFTRRREDGTTHFILPRRWSWEKIHGPIKPVHRLYNECGNLVCVNPDHQQERATPGSKKLSSERRLKRVATIEEMIRRGERVCDECETLKPFSDFTKSKVTKIGVDNFCKMCRRKRMAAYRRENQKEMRIYMNNYGRDARSKAIQHYGGKCDCCGEANEGFLSFDHINNDGYKRKDSKGRRMSNDFKGWMTRGYPTDIRVLCYNCNCGRAYNYRNPGMCPHTE